MEIGWWGWVGEDGGGVIFHQEVYGVPEIHQKSFSQLGGLNMQTQTLQKMIFVCHLECLPSKKNLWRVNQVYNKVSGWWGW